MSEKNTKSETPAAPAAAKRTVAQSSVMTELSAATWDSIAAAAKLYEPLGMTHLRAVRMVAAEVARRASTIDACQLVREHLEALSSSASAAQVRG